MQKKIILATFLILTLYKSMVFSQELVCIEIGGKKIIATSIPPSPTLQDLKNAKILTLSPSKPWLAHLPSIFKESPHNPISPLLEKPHTLISISIFGPLFKNEGLIDVAKRNIPPEIEQLCQEQSKNPLKMYPDSVCWAMGCLEYHKIKEQSIAPFPFLTVILKTGVGIALVEEDSLSALEIPYIGISFPHLEKLCIAQGQTFENFDVHKAIGNGFFDWALKKREFDDREMIPYLSLYNDRFQVFIEEIYDYIRQHMQVEISSIYVGGENARFITDNSQKIIPMTILNSQTLTEENIAPEMIQLLGCLSLGLSEKIHIKTYPSYEEILRQIEAKL